MNDAEASFCLAWDAFRIAYGLRPKKFTREQVLAWLRIAPEKTP